MKNLLYILLILLGASCKEYEPAIGYEKKEQKGTVYLTDDLTESPTVVAPAATVYLTNTPVKDNYLLKVQANEKGEFTFDYLPETFASLSLVAEYTDKSGLVYTGGVPFTGVVDNAKISLAPQYQKGKLKIKVLNAASEIENGATVSLFVNKAQADSVLVGKTATPIKSYMTNDRGIAFFPGLDQGTYYVLAQKAGVYSSVASVTVGASPSYTVAYPSPQASTTALSLTLNSTTLVSPTVQLTVLVTNQANEPLYGMNVYLFTTLSQASSVTGTVAGAVNITTPEKTNATGQAFFRKLAVGKYYAGATGIVSGTAISGAFAADQPVSVSASGAIASPSSVTVKIQ